MASESKGPDPEDVELIAKSTPVYTFFGHSCSTGEELPVPEGCVIVTLAVCGAYAYSDSQLSRFDDLFSRASSTILLDPINNKELIEEELGLLKNTLNVNHPHAERPENRMYMNTLYDAEMMWNYRLFRYHTSGLYKYPSDVSEKVNEKRLNELTNEEFGQVLNEMYTDEIVYPTQTNIIRTLGELRKKPFITKEAVLKQIGHEYQITQQQLFESNPGIYYLVSCRPPCSSDKAVKESVIKRRRNSRPWVTNEMFLSNLEKMKNSNRFSSEEEEEVWKATLKDIEERARGEATAMEAARVRAGAGAAAGHNGGRRSMRRTRRHRRRTAKRRSKAYPMK